MYIDDLVGKGLNVSILMELLFYFSLTFVPTALPLAILFASLMTFGNLGEYSELTALKSSGISLGRIMRPLMLLVGVIVIVAFLFSNYIVPYSNKEARSLLFDIRRKRPDISLQAGSFNNEIDGFSIKTAQKDPVTNRLDKILIYDQREHRGNVSVIYADSGYMNMSPDNSAMIMTLYNGYSFTEIEESKELTEKQKRHPSRKDYFKEQSYIVPLTGFDLERSSDNLYRSTSWAMRMDELKYFIDSIDIILDKRFDEYFETYKKEFLYTMKLYPDAYAEDEMYPKDVIFIPEETYNTLDESTKVNTLDMALQHLREATTYVADTYDAIKMNIKSQRKYEADWHKKLTLPFACLIFFFIGAPLGAIIRKGGLGTPSVISVFFFVVWYVISMSAEKMVQGNVVSTVVGMWASSYLLLPIGIFLTYKAANDSAIMSLDTYIENIKKFFSFRRKKKNNKA